MITAEISIYPMGTGTTSVSEYIAVAEKVLEKYPHLDHKINSMSTEISGHNIDDIFEVMKEMHLAVLENGALRVVTSFKIDDRRDKECTMEEKVDSVISKM